MGLEMIGQSVERAVDGGLVVPERARAGRQAPEERGAERIGCEQPVDVAARHLSVARDCPIGRDCPVGAGRQLE